MKKIFASDFDNTLYFHNKTPRIAPETVTAIRAFQDAGHLFGLCTGRPAFGMEENFKDLFRPDFVIASSGGVIIDADGNPLFERKIPFETLSVIERLGREARYFGAVHADGRFVMLDAPGNPFPALESIPSVEAVRSHPVHGISFMTGSETEAEAFLETVLRACSGTVTAYRNRNAVDIVPAGCSKGLGLHMAKDLFSADRTYGIGDSLNDLPLLEAADHSFTFRSAPDQLKKAASQLVDNADEALLFALKERL